MIIFNWYDIASQQIFDIQNEDLLDDFENYITELPSFCELESLEACIKGRREGGFITKRS